MTWTLMVATNELEYPETKNESKLRGKKVQERRLSDRKDAWGRRIWRGTENSKRNNEEVMLKPSKKEKVSNGSFVISFFVITETNLRSIVDQWVTTRVRLLLGAF